MAGIPVHTSSPISPHVAAKASAITPSTSAARFAPASAAHTATSSLQTQVAQPGAPVVPQPTSTAAAPAQSIPEPSPTQHLPQASDPPPPQPGAAPMPGNITRTRRVSNPVSPRTTDSNPVAPYSPAPLPAHQTSGHLDTPTRAVPPASVTSTYSGPQDLSHPPGYIQNSRASFEDRPYLNGPNDSSPFSMTGSMANRRSMGGAGILNGELYSQENRDTQEEKGVWDTAVAWAKTAGKKLSETEQEVWKRVNGEK